MVTEQCFGGTRMSQEVSTWLVNGLQPTYKWVMTYLSPFSLGHTGCHVSFLFAMLVYQRVSKIPSRLRERFGVCTTQ